MELKALCEKTTELFGIENISELSDKLLSICLENQNEYMEKFAECVGDLSVDWLQKIFQYYEADRKEKMQDYTPLTLARFVGKLTETDHEKAVYDLCAGSGALTIQKWNLNHNLFFVCYEYDKKVIPLLLFNLAVRNINALIVNGDALQDEVFTRYTVKSGEKYGTVTEHEDKVFYDLPDSCISNPPYNMKWKLPPFAQLQPRFNDCELPPESNANFAFILTALDRCKDKAVMILPNGVLSTDNPQEKAIRRYLIEQNLVETVISCPDKMFEATSIATCILVLNKQKATTHIAFVDMRQTFETEQREQNGQFGGASHENRTYKKEVKIFTDEQIQKAIDSINNQSAIPEFSKAVSIQTVAENDFILIPSRYIEFQEQDFKHREYEEIVADINRITAEKNACKLTISESLAKTLGFDIELYKQDQQDSGLNDLLKSLGAEPITKQDYFITSPYKNIIKFENNSKDIVSSVLMMIMNTWRQHIYYLNNEENRYLAELRDALLPDLMSGKIDLEGVGDLG
ncbi:MAG: N-6 DNA methylase [Firmicutes bacterium]|nr:N-6 DNA methylase [Bacillota bacterium]